jgi:hypothetical protein
MPAPRMKTNLKQDPLLPVPHSRTKPDLRRLSYVLTRQANIQVLMAALGLNSYAADHA